MSSKIPEADMKLVNARVWSVHASVIPNRSSNLMSDVTEIKEIGARLRHFFHKYKQVFYSYYLFYVTRHFLNYGY